MHSTITGFIYCLLLLSDQLYCHPLPTTSSTAQSLDRLKENLHLSTSEEFINKSDAESKESPPDYQKAQTPPLNREELESTQHLLDFVLRDSDSVLLNLTNSNISCNDLADRALLDNIRFLPLARDFCAVALIFTMEQLGCTEDLKTPLYQLYDDLGVSGTIDTLLKIRELMEKAPNGTNSLERDTVKSDNVKALLYNIRQITLQSQALAKLEIASHDFVSSNQPPEHCHGFVQITGSSLFGERHSMHEVLLDAMSKCRDLGFTCAGVTSSGNGSFEVIYREGSYCYPNQEALVWIYDCDDLVFGKGHHITKRQSDCVDQDEQKVYDIVQWIPMVSLFYNLGTSIYYGAKGCSDVAESRAIDMAVDVGTDAVIALTGGAASVAGYGVKAGIKLGAKAGLKAATQAVKARVTAVLKQATGISKQAVKEIGKDTISIVPTIAKRSVSAIKSLPSAAKQTSQQIHKQVSKLTSAIGREGVLQTSKDAIVSTAKKIQTSVKEGVDSSAEKAHHNNKEAYGPQYVPEKKLQPAGPETGSKSSIHCTVKRSPGNNCEGVAESKRRKISSDNNQGSISNTGI
ncbi:uncharacterized protein APOF [Latimeria chalumnae]|uniref:uncharacterized protein APOF n=1 Tax=Latimeria chalumnae TaxID=7897 RepID=UPI0003C1A213|nr:PREDICTED: apolipoprotein F [Latimeria chalumnae]|eukprot:XP_006012148.1 PREDICTED: apolipoprotein F [Latimeria chalumnae]